MPNMEYANGSIGVDREKYLIGAKTFPVKENPDLLADVVGFRRSRTSGGQLFQGKNLVGDGQKPPGGIFRTFFLDEQICRVKVL